MKFPILWFCLILPHLILGKSSYKDGNYSEAAGAEKMCMRCHMRTLNPSGPTLNLASTVTSVESGKALNVSSTNSQFGPDWAPGAAVHFDYNSQFASRTPQEFGWAVSADPNGGTFNFITDLPKNQSPVWQFIAPRRTGNYRLAISAYFNDSALASAAAGTVRGSNSLEITVTPTAETEKPTVRIVAGNYKKYVFVLMSEAVTEATAGNVANFSLIEKATNSVVPITQAIVSRSGEVITLKTGDHKAGSDYSLNVKNLQDYATSPNTLDEVTMDYTPNFTNPYKIYSEWSTDVSVDEIGELDEEDQLGKGLANSINRLIHVFHIGDNPLDMLPDIDFSKATLKIKQSGTTPPPSSNALGWDFYQLQPNNEGWDFFGNNIKQGGFNGPLIATQVLWSEANPVVASKVTNNQAISQVVMGAPEIWWNWDITTNFKPRYTTPGGTGPNGSGYFTRIQAATEPLNSGVVFYGADAENVSDRPYIELTIAPPDTVGGTYVKSADFKNIGLQISRKSKGVVFELSIHEKRNKITDVGIFNQKGTLVKKLFSNVLEQNPHQLFWDGTNSNLRRVPLGIYFIRINIGPRGFSKKFLLTPNLN